MKPPRVLGLVLCKSIHIDAAAAEIRLVGVFHSLYFATWPTPAQAFYAYTGQHGGGGEGIMELVVSRLETEEIVYRYQRWHTVPDPELLLHLEIPIRRCAFPATGRYGLSLRFDGIEVAFRPLDVRPQRSER